LEGCSGVNGALNVIRQGHKARIRRKYALKQGNRIGVRFIKYDIQGVFLKCAEILHTRLFDNVED
jgi:hypothetical protein